MTWEQPPEPAQLSFDDELAGGSASWYENLTAGHELPAAGDWVWGPEACDDDGEPVGRKTVCYEVVRRGWTFTSPGSMNAQHGKWRPILRVHVRKVPADSDKVDTVNEP